MITGWFCCNLGLVQWTPAQQPLRPWSLPAASSSMYTWVQGDWQNLRNEFGLKTAIPHHPLSVTFTIAAQLWGIYFFNHHELTLSIPSHCQQASVYCRSQICPSKAAPWVPFWAHELGALLAIPRDMAWVPLQNKQIYGYLHFLNIPSPCMFAKRPVFLVVSTLLAMPATTIGVVCDSIYECINQLSANSLLLSLIGPSASLIPYYWPIIFLRDETLPSPLRGHLNLVKAVPGVIFPGLLLLAGNEPITQSANQSWCSPRVIFPNHEPLLSLCIHKYWP